MYSSKLDVNATGQRIIIWVALVCYLVGLSCTFAPLLWGARPRFLIGAPCSVAGYVLGCFWGWKLALFLGHHAATPNDQLQAESPSIARDH